MGTVVGTWRLKIILVLIVFSTLIYGSYALFGDITVAETYYEGNDTYYVPANESVEYNATDIGTGEADNFITVMAGVGDFFTFGNIDNVWVRLILNVVMSCVWIAIGYVVFTFFKEFVPFV